MNQPNVLSTKQTINYFSLRVAVSHHVQQSQVSHVQRSQVSVRLALGQGRQVIVRLAPGIIEPGLNTQPILHLGGHLPAPLCLQSQEGP